MTPNLLPYLYDPETKQLLCLRDGQLDNEGRIISGVLEPPNGATHEIVNGIPRFTQSLALSRTVESFGNEWNYFNFTEFKCSLPKSMSSS